MEENDISKKKGERRQEGRKEGKQEAVGRCEG